MSEWWTYTLSDFLLFSPETYYRLYELYNRAIWPAQVVAFALGLAIWGLLRRGGPAPGRLVPALLAAAWLWVAVAFHARRYATINWAAAYFAGAFGLQAALLIGTAVFRRPLDPLRPRGAVEGRAGAGIFLFALLAQPLVGLLVGRPLRQVELFGVAPDPTALATLGVLLVPVGRVRWELIVLPAIWCFVSGATLRALDAPDAWVGPLGGVVVLSLAARRALARGRGPGPPAAKRA